MKIFSAAAVAVIGISFNCVRSSDASMEVNILSGKYTKINDGIPTKVIDGPLGSVTIEHQQWAFPIEGESTYTIENGNYLKDDFQIRLERNDYYHRIMK
jgi:hypothetical protein